MNGASALEVVPLHGMRSLTRRIETRTDVAGCNLSYQTDVVEREHEVELNETRGDIQRQMRQQQQIPNHKFDNSMHVRWCTGPLVPD